MELIEKIFEIQNLNDTRKSLNRNENVIIPTEIIKQIETEGVSTELLTEFQNKYNLSIFFYKTQITIHGIFDKIIDNNRYRYLFLNQNKSLGIKYNAIDVKRKNELMELSKYLKLFKYDVNSTEFYLYKTKNTNKETYKIDATEFIEFSKKINEFFKENRINGYSEVKLFAYLGKYILYNIFTFTNITENNYIKFIEFLFKKSYVEVILEYNEAKAKETEYYENLRKEYIIKRNKENELFQNYVNNDINQKEYIIKNNSIGYVYSDYNEKIYYIIINEKNIFKFSYKNIDNFENSINEIKEIFNILKKDVKYYRYIDNRIKRTLLDNVKNKITKGIRYLK